MDVFPCMQHILKRGFLCLMLLCSPTVLSLDYQFSPIDDPLLARQASVYDIKADKQGLLWFSSDTDGLIRFDGYRSANWLVPDSNEYNRLNINRMVFTERGDMWLGGWGEGLLLLKQQSKERINFKADSTDDNALASDRVQEIFSDSQDRIWIGSVGGVNIIYPDQPYRLTRFALNQTNHPLNGQRIWGITEFDNAIWFATSNGIVKLNSDLSTYTQLDLPTLNKLVADRAREVRNIANINNQLWALSSQGLFLYQAACQCFTEIETPEDLPTPRGNVLAELSPGRLWVGASDGLYLLDIPSLTWLKNNNNYNFLPNADVRSIHQNSSKQLWVGTRDRGIFVGLAQHSVFKPLALTMPATLQEAALKRISAVYHDKTGNLWLATPNQLLRRDPKQQWQIFDFGWQTGIRKVFKLYSDANDVLWLATDVGLFHFKDEQLTQETRPFDLANINSTAVTDLFISTTGTFYFSLWQQGMLIWQSDKQDVKMVISDIHGINGDLIHQISVQDGLPLYAASRYSGLFVNNAAQERWSRLTLPIQDDIDGFGCALPEDNGILWLCSEYGLWQFDKTNNNLLHYMPEQGLPSPYINSAFFDARGQLWALTNNGPARFDSQLQRFVSYGVADGLPDLTMQRNAYSISADGEMVLGTAIGAVVLNNEPEQEVFQPPRLVLTELIVDGVDLTREFDVLNENLELPYAFNELIIRFAVLDYWEPELNSARSRLIGLSDQWSALNNSREIRYVNLKPGKFQLEIEGQNSRGFNTIAPLRLTFSVAAPWYYSVWIWLLFIVSLLALFVLIVWLREASLRRQNVRLHDLVKQRTQELESLATQLKNRADHDPLTNLLNRDGFAENFSRLLAHAARENQAVSLVLIDIDYFKMLNDQYGHNAGDVVLQHFAKLLSQRIRGTDIVGRWGGEEFVLALANCNAMDAKVFCQQFLQLLQHDGCKYQGTQLTISATMGIASLPLSVNSLQQWVKYADEALYIGKNNGRNQAVIATIPTNLTST